MFITLLFFAALPTDAELASVHVVVKTEWRECNAEFCRTTTQISSGVVVASDATRTLFLTNRHVVLSEAGQPGRTTVRLSDQSLYSATIAAISAPDEDLAVLSVPGGPVAVVAAIAPASHCATGDVVTIGWRTGIRRGHVLGLSPKQGFQDYFTDYRSWDGDSGGPLFDGQFLIGIQTAADQIGQPGSYARDLATSPFIAQTLRSTTFRAGEVTIQQRQELYRMAPNPAACFKSY